MIDASRIAKAQKIVHETPRTATEGRIARVTGLLMQAHIRDVRIGSIVEIERQAGWVPGEVVGFHDELALVIPLSDVQGIRAGARVRSTDHVAEMSVSEEILGRAIDPFGVPVDGGPDLKNRFFIPLDAGPPSIDQGTRVHERIDTGVKVIDGLLTCGRGQRVGLFAGAGVGKTVLIRQIAAQCKADVTVLGLIGERGNEVRDMLEGGLGPKTVMVVATSDRSPMERARGARAATAVAEMFRDRGKNVLLVIDSLTRYAMALREIGLAAGEPPATKGYPPSVFAALPRLLERVSPMKKGGSITGFYTVLVEGDDLSDPVADSARSLLDGHIVLSRDLAGRGHFPAIDVLPSASRVARQVTSPESQTIVDRARGLLATKREVDELRALGAYVPGANPAYDEALTIGTKILEWSKQRPTDRSSHEEAVRELARIVTTVPRNEKR
jgi:flagellum-specific ATP synthase